MIRIFLVWQKNKYLLELFDWFEPVNEFSNIGPTAAANELELNDELSSIVELVGDGDSSNDTIGLTSALCFKKIKLELESTTKIDQNYLR